MASGDVYVSDSEPRPRTARVKTPPLCWSRMVELPRSTPPQNPAAMSFFTHRYKSQSQEWRNTDPNVDANSTPAVCLQD
ncbi:hypothetical protein SKAU_G00177050 [Synaphobranchus kaupii]|uniref:Uncharacterized protein n=1 Tax=Synaphobranchus kaupii TaxID=118154 RepID=A0A9Q1FLK1_SYNKA|nr:hypothetical protein SKAU_G00177050 [Synaphobranchus kaupii]